MQPYFFPYAGYFRLLAMSDLFIIYDCVQFPRRGWLHRNKLVNRSGVERWLTLPLVKQPQSVLIKDLLFPDTAPVELAKRLRGFPLPTPDEAWKEEVMAHVLGMRRNVVDYLEANLELVARRLGLPWNVSRSSEYRVPSTLRGQDRIIEIARRAGANRYLNSPGGVDLYDRDAFAKHGIQLAFLRQYEGPYGSMLGRILAEDPAELAREIMGGGQELVTSGADWAAVVTPKALP
jgi:hypothetical protein